MKISLYGNLIYDTVYEVKGAKTVSREFTKRITRAGAIGNVARALHYIDPNNRLYVNSHIGWDEAGRNLAQELDGYNVDSSNLLAVNDKPTSEALVVCEGSDKTGYVKWGACKELNNFNPNPTEWSHFCYIDNLAYLTARDLKNLEGQFVSADLCNNTFSNAERSRIYGLLHNIDFLILSDSEAMSLANSIIAEEVVDFLTHLVKRAVIMHHHQGSIVGVKGKKQMEFSHKTTYNNTNVLGAGDYFAASFINEYMHVRDIDEQAMKFVHAHTGYLLRTLNE
jgi:sugar/nucleoside kinase (ribokinase family)